MNGFNVYFNWANKTLSVLCEDASKKKTLEIVASDASHNSSSYQLLCKQQQQQKDQQNANSNPWMFSFVTCAISLHAKWLFYKMFLCFIFLPNCEVLNAIKERLWWDFQFFCFLNFSSYDVLRNDSISENILIRSRILSQEFFFISILNLKRQQMTIQNSFVFPVS